MTRYPGARWRPVTRYQPGGSVCVPMSRYDGGIDHTFVGSPSSDAAYAHFNTSGTPIPHFMFFRDGTVDQYVDTRFRSSACLEGNPRLIAWETADGFPSLWTNGQAPKDTPELVRSKAKLMVWLHKEHGIPLTQMPSSRPTARGMGWHRLGCDGNYEQPDGQLLGGRVPGGESWSSSPGKVCPTTRRIHQFVEETLPLAVKLNAPPAPEPTKLRRKVGHSRKGQPEYKGDSYRGIQDAVKRRCEAIDFNLRLTKDHELAVEHWPKPLGRRGGFHDPLGEIDRDTLITDMTWEQVARLETKDKPPYKINTAEDLFNGATNNNLDVEGELKQQVSTGRLKKLLDKVHQPNRVIFKAIIKPKEKSWNWLVEAHKAGRPTLAICPRPFMVLPEEVKPHITHYRRFKPRFK
jgi:hypothetical protein